MNKVTLIGRMVRDAEIRTTNSGKMVARFTLAVNRRGEGADFISCNAWDKTAELLEKYTHKSDRIGIAGRIQTGSYTDKNGNKVYTTDVIADEIEFLEKKQDTAPKTDENGFMSIPDGINEELPFD